MASYYSKKEIIKNDDIIDENTKSDFDKFLEIIRLSTFSVLFVLLNDDDSENLLVYLLQAGLDYFQILSFIFDPKVSNIWKSKEVLFPIFGLFQYLNFLKLFQDFFTWRIYLVVFFSCVWIIWIIWIDIIYVSYSFSRNRFSLIWPLTLLKTFVNFFVTVLFLPIIETLLSMIYCEQKDGISVLSAVTNQNIQCWVGYHIVFAIISIVFTFIFVVISLIVVWNYFESRIKSKNPTARSNSRGDVAFVLCKIILEVSFSFIPENLNYILIFFLFICSLIMFYFYNIEDPYYNHIASKVFKLYNGIFLWSSFLLLISKLLFDTNFNGGLLAWLIGIPFIFIIIISKSKNSLNTLIKNQIKFETPSDLINHNRFVLELIESQNYNKNSYLLLAGYIEKHKDLCLEQDCPLKVKKKKSDLNFKESIKKLLYVLDRLYISGLKKFKNSCKLRVNYAFFLIEMWNNKKKALEELSYAGTLKPHFDEQFWIYRYKKIIEDELDDSNQDQLNNNEIDVVGMIALQTHLTMCTEFIKKSSEYHKEFWMELWDDIPNLDQINSIGSKIDWAITNANENWNKLNKINSSNFAMLRLYGKFCINVLNQKELGKKLIEKSKNLALKILENKKLNYENLEKLNEPNPIIIAGNLNKKPGYIKKINMLFCSVFGYTRDEILDKKINVIMADIYSKNHDYFLNHFLENINDEKESNYINKERYFFGKNKMGFIFPIFSKVKISLSDDIKNDSIIFIDIIKTDPKTKNTIYIISDKDGKVMDISSNAITYIKDEISNIQNKTFNIKKIVPNFITDHKFRMKLGKDVNYKNNDGEIIIFNVIIESVIFNLTSILVDKPKINENIDLQGFIFKLNPVSQSSYINEKSRIIKENNSSDSDFNNINNNIYEEEKNNIFDYLEENNNDFNNDSITSLNHENNGLNKIEKIDFGKDITTYRLLDNGDLEDIRKKLLIFKDGELVEDNQIEYNFQNSIYKERLNNYKKLNQNITKIKRINLLKETINNSRELLSIKLFKFVSFIWILLIIIINSIQLFKTTQFLDLIRKNISILNNVNYLNNNLGIILNDVLNFESFSKNYDFNNNLNRESILNSINNTSTEILKINQYLNMNGFLNYNITLKNNTQINYSNHTYIYIINNYDAYSVNFNEIILEISSNILHLLEPQNKIYDSIWYFSKVNFYLLITDLWFNYRNIFFQEFIKEIGNFFIYNLVNIILIGVLILITVFYLILFIYFSKYVKYKKEEILFLFLDIPKNDINDIYKKCENFMNFCNVI